MSTHQRNSHSILLRGRISDTSGNWLPQALVTLVNIGSSAVTDGNGLFEIPIPQVPDAPAQSSPVEILRIEKDRHRQREIKIQSRDFFTRFAELEIEPNGVGDDSVHLSVSLPGLGTQQIGDGILPEEDPERITPLLSERLDALAAKNRHTLPPADFYCWIPPGVKPLRAVFLISLHGMGCVDNPVLRRFAENQRVALVGLRGLTVQRGIYPTVLLDAPLQELGIKTGHPEIASLPVLLFGHSNGTGHATTYASSRPDRVIAWVSYHSGYGWQLLLPGLEKSPGLILHGQLDKYFENGQEAAFRHLRSVHNAPVAMMVEGNVGHGPLDTEATWEFIVAFCEACMRLRLGSDSRLHPVQPASGWLGGCYDRAAGGPQLLPVNPYPEFAGEPSNASWLPDERFARVWQRYGATEPAAAQSQRTTKTVSPRKADHGPRA